MEFKIGQIVDLENYTQAAIACNQTGDRHIEEQDGQYIIVSNPVPPEPTEEEINQEKASNQKAELREMAVTAMMTTLSGGNITSAKNAYIEKLNAIEDSVAVYMPEVFPVWDHNSVSYTKGQRIFYNDVLYKVLTDHTSQESWTPETAPSLFVKVIGSISGEIPEWQQPSADNAYMKGDIVMFEGKKYESIIDNNVWSPTEYPAGWKDITDEQTVES